MVTGLVFFADRIGAPQLGQVVALVLTCAPHSLHFANATVTPVLNFQQAWNEIELVSRNYSTQLLIRYSSIHCP
jgi:hypothetical protein